MFKAKIFLSLCLMILLLGAGGCGMGNLSQNLSNAIMNQDDPETVRLGAPAYLLLVDSFIEGDPDNEDMLQLGAGLYGAYAAVFVDDPERASRLAKRAKRYGERALCEQDDSACGLAVRPYDEFVEVLQGLNRRDLPALYSFTVSWLISIKANSSDWTALADLPKVEAALDRMVELDETYERGSAHLYLGILNSLRPPALGGKPEDGRRHFERAIALSDGKDLGVKVEYARGYARLVYDHELHDRLLREVLAADADSPRLTLLNMLAKEQAEELLLSGEDYF